MKLDDYLVAVKNLAKHDKGLPREVMRTQLDKYARRELSSNEYRTFELLFDFYFTEGFIKNVLYPDTNKTSVEDFLSVGFKS